MYALSRGIRKKRLAVLMLIVSILSSLFAGQALALQERGMVEKVLTGSEASVLNASWLEIYMRENEYNASNVTNTSYYSITSSDDPDFRAPVKPVLVNHRYFPEDGPYSDTVGGNPAKLNEIYRILLKLPVSKKLKEGKTYTVTVDPAVVTVDSLTTTFDPSVPNDVIHVNQVGYITDGPKVAYLSDWTGEGSVSFADYPTFYLIDESTGKSVYSGSVHFDVAGADEKWGKSDLYSLDFSSFKPEGKYHLYIPGVGSSYSFVISSSVYKDQIGYTLIRGLTMQRDGDTGLDDPNVTHFNRPDEHMDDAIEESTGKHIDLTGGHMDAGDRGKYPYNVASMSTAMLDTALLFPDQIEAQGESLEIPESGNGIPDYLDELVYELDFLYKVVMNTSKDGAVSGYIHPGHYDANTGKYVDDGYEQGQPLTGATNRVYFDVAQGPYKAETLYAAGALAMAYNSPMLQKYLPADKLDGFKTAALRAFGAFETHKDDDSFWKAEDDLYNDTTEMGTPHTWSDEMLIAAAQLHQMTGDDKYLAWINSEMTSKPLGSGEKKWGWVNEGPWLDVFLSLKEDTYLDEGLRNNAAAAILDWADNAMAPSKQQPYGVPMVDDTLHQVGWYFSGSAIGYPMMLAYGISHDEKYRDQIVKTWNYLLGSNPLSNSYISGLGDPQKSPHWLTHEISQHQWQEYKDGSEDGDAGWTEMMPGLPNADLQDGNFPSYFNDSWNLDRVNKKYPALADYAPLYRYTDTWNTTNEFVTQWATREASSIIPLIPTDLFTLNATAEHGTISPAGGSYSAGTELSLSITPDLGYQFTGWSGDATGTDNPLNVTMDASKNIVAAFAPIATHTLETTADHGTIVLDPPGGAYNEGDSVTVSVYADSGYRFTGWSGDLSGTANPQTIIMDGDKSISASFEAAPTHTLTIEGEGEGGQVLRSPDKTAYQEGESVTLEALPADGYVFDGWSGDLTSTDNPAVVTIGSDMTVTANFRALPKYDLTVNATEGGSVSPPSGTYVQGSKVTLQATPQTGYLFIGWSGDVTGVQNPIDVTMDQAKTITANFASKYGVISQDITTTVPGSTNVADGVYTIQAGGENVWAAPDGFRYTYEAGLKGSFSLVARLDSLTVGNSNGGAGVMIRTSPTNNAAYADIFVQNIMDGDTVTGHQIVSRFRKGGDYSDNVKTLTDASLPVWLKITRGDPDGTGSLQPWNVRTYYSADGVNWTLFSGADTDKPGDFWGWMDANSPELTAGLFAFSGSPDQWPRYTTAQFSNVTWPRDPATGTGPVITLDQADGTVIHEQYAVSGGVFGADTVNVQVGDGLAQSVAVDAGQFSATVTLAPGDNTITVTATDDEGHAAEPAVLHITYNQPLQAIAYRTETAPTLDGDISDDVWSKVMTNTVTRSIQNDKVTGNSDNTLRYGLLWDSQNLYVSADVTDATVITGKGAYDNDGVEVYVDMGDQKTVAWDNDNSQLAVGPGDTAVTAWRTSTGVVAKSVVTDTGYTMEMAIPWSTFGVTPSENMRIGFDIGANDDDSSEGTGRTGVLMWSGTMNNWTDSSAYGEAQLSGDSEPSSKPVIALDQTDTTVTSDQFSVSGSVYGANAVNVQVGNGEAQAVAVDSTGRFSTTVTLASGDNTITVTASNDSGEAEPAVIHVAYNEPQPQREFTIGTPVFTSFDGTPVTALTPSGFIKTSVDLTNSTGAAKQATLIIALYDANGSVKNISYVNKTVGAGQTETLNTGFSLPAGVAGDYVKVFVWDSLSGMHPLSDAVTFPQQR